MIKNLELINYVINKDITVNQINEINIDIFELIPTKNSIIEEIKKYQSYKDLKLNNINLYYKLKRLKNIPLIYELIGK